MFLKVWTCVVEGIRDDKDVRPREQSTRLLGGKKSDGWAVKQKQPQCMVEIPRPAQTRSRQNFPRHLSLCCVLRRAATEVRREHVSARQNQTKDKQPTSSTTTATPLPRCGKRAKRITVYA